MVVFNNCTNLMIRTIPCFLRSKGKSEDIEPVDDHAFDGLTYGSKNR